MKKLLLIMLICSSNVYADNAVYLNKGDVAPNNGVLLSEEAAKAARNNILDLEYEHRVNMNLTDEVKEYNKMIDNYKTNNENLEKRLRDTNTGLFSSIGYFMLGTAATVLVTFAVRQAVK